MGDRDAAGVQRGAVSRLVAGLGILVMAAGIGAIVYFAPRYREEALLQREDVETIDATVWRLDGDTSMLTYVLEVGDRRYRRTVKITPDEMAAASRERRVRVRYWTLQPSVSAVDRRLRIDLHLRRNQILVSATVALCGLILAFCSASWEHITPMLDARRERRPIPALEVKKTLHNLAVLIALGTGVTGGAGFIFTGSFHPTYAEHRWYYGVALFAGIIGFKALQRWTPFSHEEASTDD